MAQPAIARSGESPLRVLHVITGLGVGGAETMLYRLATTFDPAVVESRILALTPGGGIEDRLREACIPVHTLGMRRAMVLPPHIARLKQVVHAFRPDVVHGWMPHGNLVATMAARVLQRGTPLVWGIRQALYDLAYDSLNARLAIRLGASLSGTADAIVYNSDVAAAQHAAIGYAAARASVLPNGFDVARFRPDAAARADVRGELGIDERTPLIGLIARYHPMKDHATFLTAAARLVAGGSDAHFLLAGEGVNPANRALATLLRETGIGPRVHLLGQRDDTPRLYAAMDVAALASYTEGFPNVLGEAMACGVPCVSTDVGAARSIIGDAGRIVPVRDPAAMVSAWTALLAAGPDRLRAMGTAARDRIARDWTIQRVTAQYGELYARVRSGSARR